MSASMTWSGLQDLARELGGLPDRVKPAVGTKLLAGANRAGDALRARYDAIPRYEGDDDGPGLSKGVRVDASELLAPRLQSRAPHAHLWEFGTASRATSSGANRGRMPAGNAMVPIVEAERARLGGELGTVLTEASVFSGLQTLERR